MATDRPQALPSLDVWTSALRTKSSAGRGGNGKVESYGIKKLRELILELAVRGKLVPQDPNDEPTSVLLEEIFHKKARLNIEGRIRKQEQQPSITDSEKPYYIPVGWEWVRLGDVVEIVRGITFPASEKSRVAEEGRVACLRTTNVQDRIEWNDLLYVRREFATRDEQFVRVSDIVMSTANSRELVGKVAIIEEEPEFQTAFGGFLTVLRPILLDPSFVMVSLRTPVSRNALIDSASQTTNIANISIGKLNPLVLAIPPLAEQHRIVAKVDELMALCDQLEQQQTDSLAAHQTLVETLLGTLTRVESQKEFSAAWARIANHFDTLFATEASIDQLEQTLLQLAVMGRLVPQDPDDEPASRLLRNIQAAKKELIADGKIKGEKTQPLIASDEKWCELPSGWEWVRFSDYAVDIATGPFGSMIHQSDYVVNGVPLINPSHMINDRIVPENGVAVSEKMAKGLESYSLADGDIVMARRGEVGRIALVTKREVGWLCGTGSFVLRFSKHVVRDYLKLVFRCDFIRKYLVGEAVGTTMVNLNHGILKKMPFAVPPVAEQHRIVAKVDELMALCDALKARIKDAQTTQSHLADAIVEQAVR